MPPSPRPITQPTDFQFSALSIPQNTYIPPAPLQETSLHNTSASSAPLSPTSSQLSHSSTYSFYGIQIRTLPSQRLHVILPYLHFAYLITHVLLFYIIAGVIQESIFSSFSGFKFGWFMTLWQFGAYALFSCAQIVREGRIEARRRDSMEIFASSNAKAQRERNSLHKNIILNQDDDTILGAGNPTSPASQTTSHSVSYDTGELNTASSFDWRTFLSTKKASAWKIIMLYMILASLSVLGMGFGNQALNYLNYPTKILFKSCKLLSVMLVGLVLLKKKYSRMDYLASISLIAGLFTLYTANRAVNLEFPPMGVALMVLALLADSVTSNFQEKLLQDYDQSPLNLIFYVHALGFVHLFFVCLFTDQMRAGFSFCLQHPSLSLFLILYSLCSFIGAQYLHSLTKRSDILITLTVTSVRKVLSILISFLIFPKPIHYGHFVAIILVFVGVSLRVLNKAPKKKQSNVAGSAPIIAPTTTKAD